jgi:hypothetical protein
VRTFECAREADTIDAVTAGRFDPELRDHVAVCSVCADLATVISAVQSEHAGAWEEARVPPSGLVWWRMELRARHEAARAAARPITIAQAFAAACGLALAAALLAAALPWFGLGNLPAAVLAYVKSGAVANVSAFAVQWAVPLVLAIAAWIIVAPLALYLVFSDE